MVTYKCLDCDKIVTQEYIKKIMRVTIGDIQSVANDVFFNKRATLALIGPHKNASLFQNILAKL